MLVRPRGVAESTCAGIGGAAMLITTAVSFPSAWDEVRQSGDVLLFLLGMMILTAIVEASGVFDYLAEGCARLARGSGALLLANTFLLGAIVTTLLSLDAMIIVMTPIIYALTTRRRLDPLPFMFACAFVANTGSLMLPVSNLTNLLAFNDLHLGFAAFASRMWLPNLFAIIANYLVFRWLFRARIPKQFDRTASLDLPPKNAWFWCCAVVLLATLLGLIGLGLARRPLSIAALTGAGVLLLAALIQKRVTVGEVVRGASPSLFVFVIGLLIVVRGVERAVVDHLAGLTPASPHWAMIAGAVAAALGSNVLNNVPVTLLALSVAKESVPPIREAFTYGVLAGANIGPTLTTYGSLATMLWLTMLRKRGFSIETRTYMRVSIVTMPIVLLAAVVGLLFTS
jgi:arsenical pump membrane protein